MMKNFRKALLTAILLLSACMAGGETAGAVNWYWVESSADYSLYIDTDTVKRNNGYVKVWSKYTYSDGHFDMVQYLFNTGYQRSAIMNAATYDKDGNQTSVFTPSVNNYKWDPVIPESAIGDIYALL